MDSDSGSDNDSGTYFNSNWLVSNPVPIVQGVDVEVVIGRRSRAGRGKTGPSMLDG